MPLIDAAAVLDCRLHPDDRAEIERYLAQRTTAPKGEPVEAVVVEEDASAGVDEARVDRTPVERIRLRVLGGRRE